MQQTAEYSSIIQRDHRKAVWEIYKNEPMCMTCSGLLKQFLFSCGLVATKKRKRIHSLAMDINTFDDTWIPICQDILDNVLCFGYFVAHIDRDEGTARILSWEQYDIWINQKQKYRVHCRIAKDEDILVLDGFGSSPCTDGKLQSVISALQPMLHMWREMVDLAVVAERRRADPVIFTELHPTLPESTEGVAYDVYADGTRDNEDIFYRDSQAVEQLQEMMRNSENVRGIADNTKSTDRVVTLPMGQRISNPSMPQVRTDFVKLRTQVCMTICECMGVPYNVVCATSGSVASDSFATHSLFRNTLQFWKNSLERSINFIISQMTVKTVADTIVEGATRKTTKVKVDAAVKRKVTDMQILVDIPITPFITTEQAHDLYTRGVLVPKEYIRILSKILGIDENMLQIPVEPEPETTTTTNAENTKTNNTDTTQKKKQTSTSTHEDTDNDTDNDT